jgi:inner membrane protein
MASFGHVAAGMLTGRLHGGKREGGREDKPAGDRRPGSLAALLVFAGLALLPDADVVLVALGACDDGLCGHRGASHSLPMALAIGLLAGAVARRLSWPVIRTIVAATCAVASHAVLDILSAGGRGLPLFWPFSDQRFASPVRLLSDAPRGLALLSLPGAISVAIELLVFLPMMIYAAWPRIAAWWSARATARAIAALPELTFVNNGSGTTPAPAPVPVAPDQTDPPLRSAG